MSNHTDDHDYWNDSGDGHWTSTIRVALVLDIDTSDTRTFDEHTARSQLRRLTTQLTDSGWTAQPVRVDINGYPHIHRD